MTILICDFDETITCKDTISLLAKLPYLSPPFPPAWSHFIANYAKGYTLHKPGPRQLPLLDAAFPISASSFRQLLQSEIQYQDSLRPIELYSIHELERLHAFSGISTEQVAHFARSLHQIVRNGFVPLWQRVSQVHILSVNWSREFIHEVLISAAADNLPNHSLPSPEIYCNALLLRNEIYTGEFDKGILTGADKLRRFEALLPTLTPGKPVWYVGDSETDLLTILHPNVNGVILLEPNENYEKFQKITTTVLGLDPTEVKQFATNLDVDSWAIPCKQNGNQIYLVKSWNALAKIIR